MNIIKSVKSRSQNQIIQHFEKSRYGRRLKAFKDIHKGGRCFVLGNGPSLSAQDLTLLAHSGEITFASNRIFNIFKDTSWRPTYYACEDPIIIRDIEEQINRVEAKEKFIPIDLHWYKGVNIENALYFNMVYQKQGWQNEYGFSPDIAKGVACRGTVTVTCMQLAAYMGFAEIYLIGVDHNYKVTLDKDGNTVVDHTVKDYFSSEYDKGIQNELVHNVAATTKSFMDVQRYCEQNGIKVYNATRGGKLEVFERADLDALLAGGKNG